jgi:hypothetical protein
LKVLIRNTFSINLKVLSAPSVIPDFPILNCVDKRKV